MQNGTDFRRRLEHNGTDLQRRLERNGTDLRRRLGRNGADLERKFERGRFHRRISGPVRASPGAAAAETGAIG